MKDLYHCHPREAMRLFPSKTYKNKKLHFTNDSISTYNEKGHKYIVTSFQKLKKKYIHRKNNKLIIAFIGYLSNTTFRLQHYV